jgi:hypothetical protein
MTSTVGAALYRSATPNRLRQPGRRTGLSRGLRYVFLGIFGYSRAI